MSITSYVLGMSSCALVQRVPVLIAKDTSMRAVSKQTYLLC